MSEDIFNGCGVEITINNNDDFLVVKETLTRIGVASQKDKRLFQSCHILHKRGRFRIVHFKEMFILDGKHSDFSEQDKGRRNTICNLLAQWKLVNLVDPKATENPIVASSLVKVIPYKEKDQWELVAKYNIGKKKQ